MDKQQKYEFEQKRQVLVKWLAQFNEKELISILASVHDVITYRRHMDEMLQGFYQPN